MCPSLSIIFGVVPEEMSAWKPETAPQAIVMQTKGKTGPAKIKPLPSMNRVSAGICMAGSHDFKHADVLGLTKDQVDSPKAVALSAEHIENARPVVNFFMQQINPFLVKSGLTKKQASLKGLFAPQFTQAYLDAHPSTTTTAPSS